VQRTAFPIAHWLDGADAAGGELGSLLTRLTGGGDHTVVAGRRAVSVSVLTAGTGLSPVLATADGQAVLPIGFTATFSSDYPGDSLEEFVITTEEGDDVMIVETFLRS
jgi:hypothetical protein